VTGVQGDRRGCWPSGRWHAAAGCRCPVSRGTGNPAGRGGVARHPGTV